MRNKIYSLQKTKIVGVWDKTTGGVHLRDDDVDWSLQSDYTSTYPHIFASDTLETPSVGADDSSPVSVCSTPCSLRQYSIQQELPCCWECRSVYLL